MSILERLKKLYLHNCCNCIHLDILPDEPEAWRYDCFCPDFDWGDGYDDKPYRRGDPQYYWDPEKENDCKHFQNKN